MTFQNNHPYHVVPNIAVCTILGSTGLCFSKVSEFTTFFLHSMQIAQRRGFISPRYARKFI